MRRYETIVIIDPDIPESEREDLFKKTQAIIESSGGQVIEFDKWGNKKLAYPVNKKYTGYYLRIDYYCDDNEIIKKLETSFKHNEKAMKYITVLLDKEFNPDTLQKDDAKEEVSVEEVKTESVETKAEENIKEDN